MKFLSAANGDVSIEDLIRFCHRSGKHNGLTFCFQRPGSRSRNLVTIFNGFSIERIRIICRQFQHKRSDLGHIDILSLRNIGNVRGFSHIQCKGRGTGYRAVCITDIEFVFSRLLWNIHGLFIAGCLCHDIALRKGGSSLFCQPDLILLLQQSTAWQLLSRCQSYVRCQLIICIWDHILPHHIDIIVFQTGIQYRFIPFQRPDVLLVYILLQSTVWCCGLRPVSIGKTIGHNHIMLPAPVI